MRWFQVHLPDGCWLRLKPVDSDLLYYLIEPANGRAVRVKVERTFLAVWAAFIHVSRLALAAIERQSYLGEFDAAGDPASADETGAYVAIQQIDRTPAGTRLLGEIAGQMGQVHRDQTISVAAGFGG